MAPSRLRAAVSSARKGGVLSPPKSSVRTVAMRCARGSSSGASTATCSSSVGHAVAVEKRHLAAQQPDSLGAALECGLDLGSRAGVGEQAHGTTVGRDGGLAPLGVIAFGLGSGQRHALLEAGTGGGVGVENDEPAIGVHAQRGPVGDLQQRGTGAGHQRDAERTCHDRRVRRDAAAGECDRRDPPAPGRDLARAEVFRQDDRSERRLYVQARRELAGAACDRAQIGRAGGEVRVVEQRERLHVRFGCLGDRRARGQPALRCLDGGLDEIGVARHELVGLHDLGVGRVPGFTQRCRERGQLGGRQLESAPHLHGVLLGRAARLLDVTVAGPRRAERGARGGRVAAQRRLAHEGPWTACSSAEMISAAEVAPGSWWPIERSPR